VRRVRRVRLQGKRAYEVEVHPLSRISPYMSVMSVITLMVARKPLIYAVSSMTMSMTMV
jgi:hypothetical protein